ncbi:MAG: DUF4173 domain-containing protein [Pyrinomonadaceae bacterium]|nr:DUF4173 domain-containing protein [Pyrinomonadaceae bacterium]
MSEETIKPLMSERTKFGLEVLEAAVLLGILGDVMLRATPWGLNVLLFIAALVAAMIALVYRRKKEFWNFQTLSLHGALIFFGAMFIWRDAIQLKVFDTLAILSILAILTLPALKIPTQTAGVMHYGFGWIWSGISAAFAPFALFFEDIKWKTIPQTGWTRNLTAVFRGLAIATPILLIFGALFMAADAVFQGIIEKTFNIDPAILFTHILLIGVLSWGISGYFRASMMGFAEKSEDKAEIKPQTLSITESVTEEKTDEPQTKTEPKKEENIWDWRKLDSSLLPQSLTLGAIETSIILGLMDLLFLSFVIVQIPYLFGGFELVQNTPDFKLADYARRGFGELVVVSALVLPILLFSHWLLRKDNSINEKIYRFLAGFQIILLFVIMLSATQRLFVLTGNLGYGLTTQRFYPMAFMAWLAIVFVWFGLTVLRGTREQFAWGALWSALFVLGTLHVLSPDDFIARTNIRLMHEGRSFDAYYHNSLSDDAAPVLLENLDTMSFDSQCRIKAKFKRRLDEVKTESDFRSFNFSRWKAKNWLEQSQESFNTTGCPPYTQYRNYNDFSD